MSRECSLSIYIVLVLHLYPFFLALSTVFLYFCIFFLFISFENERKNENKWKMKCFIGKTVEFYTHICTHTHINGTHTHTHLHECAFTHKLTHTTHTQPPHKHHAFIATKKGGLSNPKPIKSVIGLFRRESTTSNSAAGSDPCLAAQLAELAMASTSGNHPPSIAATSGAYRASISGVPSEHFVERPTARGDRRRSISICAVTPIDENSEGVDPLGALIELKSNDKYSRKDNIYCKNNRRRSLFELSG